MASAPSPSRQPFLFQLLDVTTQSYDNEPLVLLFGRMAGSDESVCIRIQGVYPHFYIPKPLITTSPGDTINEFLAMKRGGEEGGGGGAAVPSLVQDAKLVRMTDTYNFNQPADFWRISLYNSFNVRPVRDAINDGSLRPGAGFSHKSYSSDWPFEYQAQIDMGITNSEWCQVENWHTTLQRSAIRMSLCKQEYMLDLRKHGAHVIHRAPDVLVPTRYRVMSFDIEVAGERGIFPEPEKAAYPVIQIAFLVCSMDDSQAPLAYEILTWRPATLPLPAMCEYRGLKAQYIQLSSEAEMLRTFFAKIQHYDVDGFTGWNIGTFDVPYVTYRSARLSVAATAWGRLSKARVFCKKRVSDTKAHGSREQSQLKGVSGRFFADAYIYVLKERKDQRDYHLDAIARALLSYQNAYDVDLSTTKVEEVHYVQISGVGMRSPATKLEELASLLPCSLIEGGAPHLYDCCEPPILLAVTRPLCRETYRLTFDRNIKTNLLFIDLYNEARVLVGFVVAARASDEHKDEMHYTQITEHWNGDDAMRARLASYCLKDASLPWMILSRLRALHNLGAWEEEEVSAPPPRYLPTYPQRPLHESRELDSRR